MEKLFFVIVCLAFTLSSCATVNNAVVKQGYDFSVIKSVRVCQFSSACNEKCGDISGVVQGAFIRQLLAKGYDVVSDVNVNVDAVIEGSITKSRRKTFVPDDSDVRYGIASYSFGKSVNGCGCCKSSKGCNKCRSRSASSARIMKEEVSVSISAYMTDLKTGQAVIVLSTCSEKDEDIDSAVSKIVKYFLKTLPKQ